MLNVGNEVPFSTELPNMGCVQVSLYEQGFKDVMRGVCFMGDWSILKAYGFLFSCWFGPHLTQFLIYDSKCLYEKHFLWFLFAESKS